MTWGVDYASVDGNHVPQFADFKQAGGSFVWIRASYGAYDAGHNAWRMIPDAVFARDWAAVKQHDLLRGAYMGPSVLASHSPQEQVGVFHASVQAAGGFTAGVDFPPCLDVEFPQGIKGTGLSREGVLEWIRSAVAEMRRLFGCWPIIYTSGRVWNDVDADCLGNPPAPDLIECPLWLARYAYATRQPAVLPPPEGPAPPVPTPWGDEFHAHQDQGDALGVPGFTSTVDVDRFRVAVLGNKGGHVAWAQRKLRLTTDGDLGPNTQGAIRGFQAAQQLDADGAIGPRTFAALAWL